MTGFYSKDFILESAYGQFYFSSTVVYFIATIAAIFTTLYSVKVLYLTFLSNPHGSLINYKQAHEGDIFMSLPAWRRGMSPVVGDKLSNSGDALKLLIPNYIRKIICGWTNYSGMVTSQKIDERKMGYRGSKSVILNNVAVKEQRVDGGWCSSLLHLRCTLKGFERNYQVRILSNPGWLRQQQPPSWPLSQWCHEW